MFHEGNELIRRGNGNPTQANTSDSFPINLRGDRHKGLVFQMSAAFSSLDASHVYFVYFNLASQLVPIRKYHHAAQLL